MADWKSFGPQAPGVSRYSLDNSLYGNAFYLILNNVAGALLGLLFWTLMAREFAPATVGIGSTLVSASGLVATLANLSLGTGLVRFIPETGDRAWELVNSVFCVTALTAAAGSLIYLAGVARWSPALSVMQKSWFLAAGFVLTSVLATSSGLMDSSFVARRSCKLILVKNLAGSLISMPLPFGIFVSLGGYGMLFSFGLATLVVMAVLFAAFLPRVYRGFRLRPRLETDLLRKILPFSFRNYLAGLLGNSTGFIFLIAVLNLLGAAKSAFFFLAWLIASVIGTIPNAVATSLFAESSHRPQDLCRYMKRAIGLTMVLLGAGIGITGLAAHRILAFLGHGYMSHDHGILFWLLAESIPGAVNVFYATVNQVKDRVHLVVWQSFATTALTLGLSYVLLPKAGLTGLGMGYALANLVVALVVAGPLWQAAKEGTGFRGLGGCRGSADPL